MRFTPYLKYLVYTSEIFANSLPPSKLLPLNKNTLDLSMFLNVYADMSAYQNNIIKSNMFKVKAKMLFLTLRSHTYTYRHIYVHACMDVCVWERAESRSARRTS